MSASVQAVFLSYASQDAEAARRICEALRAAGIEVWFDQNELVGGDAWDAKIRKQIKECALFVPIISANTQARAEGYFRREWKLAVDRTHDLADHVTFLLPVVIDGTTDGKAFVPDKFREVQWTRLRDALDSDACVSRVIEIFAARCPPTTEATAPIFQSPRSPRRRSPGPVLFWLISVAAILVMLAAGVMFYLRRAGPAAVDKSIAVLPFVNMSSDAENEYLSDGITEELLNALARVPGLRVPARTSSFVFKNRKQDVKSIGELLRVKTVLEGSVRRTGNQLRITAQLINVADGYHLWSETYDRDMTNIFAIQDDIARAIVGKLRVTLDPHTSSLPHRTDDIGAYELVLKGRFYMEKLTEPDLRTAITHFESSLVRQPNYARAYAALALTYGWIRYLAYVPPSSVESQLRAATAKALALDETSADAHVARAGLACYIDRDWKGAEEGYRRALQLDPSNVTARSFYALVLSITKRNQDALKEARKAVQIDPLSPLALEMLGWVQFFAGDTEGAVKTGEAGIALAPNYFRAHQLFGVLLCRQGDFTRGLAELEEARRLGPGPETQAFLALHYGRAGRKGDAQKILVELLATAQQRYVPAIAIANAYDGLGDVAQTHAWRMKAIAEREGRVVFIGVSSDEMTRANPHYHEWLKQLGLPP